METKIPAQKTPTQNLVLSIWLPSRPELDLQTKLTKLFLQWAKDISPLTSLDSPKLKPKDIARSISNIWDPNISHLYWGMNLEVGKSILFLKSISYLCRNAYNFFYRYDIDTRVSIGPNRKSAWAISRYSNQAIKIISKNNLRKITLDLPIECLEIDNNSLSEIKEIGINTIKDIEKIQKSEINERYSIQVSKSLAQLIEGEESSIELPEREKRVFFQKTLEYSIYSQEFFFELIKISLKEVCDVLKSKNLTSTQFDFNLFFEKQGISSFSYPLSVALDSEITIWKVLKHRIEIIPYENCFSITIIAKRLESKKEFQRTIEIEPPKEEENSDKLLTFLEEASSIISEKSIKIHRQGCSHLEEDCGGIISIDHLKFILKTSFIKNKNLILKNNLNEVAHLTKEIPEDRPSIIIENPLKIKIAKCNSNITLKFKNISLAIKNILGPEIIETNWWFNEIAGTTRHYYKLQLETGLWIWIFKDLKNKCWLLHGIWS